MSGETEKQVSAWTSDTLKELTVALIAGLRKELEDQKELLQAENASTAEALKVARDVLEKRLEGLNELRKEVTNDRQQFVKLDVYTPAHEALRVQRVADNEKAIQLTSQVNSNSTEIARMQSSLLWLTRLIFGALILALITYLVQKLLGR